MFREFVLTLTSTPTSIWTLLINGSYIDSRGYIIGSNSEAIITDRVAELDVRPGDANTSDTLYRDNSGTGDNSVLTNMSKRSNRNSICLRDYLFSNAGATQKLVVEIESV